MKLVSAAYFRGLTAVYLLRPTYLSYRKIEVRIGYVSTKQICTYATLQGRYSTLKVREIHLFLLSASEFRCPHKRQK